MFHFMITKHTILSVIRFQKRFLYKNLVLRKQFVLGIESSCDESGAAVIDSEGKVLGESLHSQQQMHLEYGGIIPILAKRFHLKNIGKVVEKALEKSGLTIHDLDAIATTVKPGLKLSLLMGVNYTKELLKQSQKPFIPIHHMEAHALVVRMIHKVDYPFLVLLISGGHCQIAVVRSVNDFLLLGTTLDNSPGQVLDKVARRLKLKNIPACSTVCGGRAIELIAKSGNPLTYEFPRPLSKVPDCNFSFSGLRSRAIEVIEEEEKLNNIEADGLLPNLPDFCASFQNSITSYLIQKIHRAMRFCEQNELIPINNKKLVISGGVGSNQYIRSSFCLFCNHMEYELVCPPPHLCTDNGMMIAWNGIEHLRAGTRMIYDPEQIEVEPECTLGQDMTGIVRNAGIKAYKFKLDNDEVMKLIEMNVR